MIPRVGKTHALAGGMISESAKLTHCSTWAAAWWVAPRRASLLTGIARLDNNWNQLGNFSQKIWQYMKQVLNQWFSLGIKVNYEINKNVIQQKFQYLNWVKTGLISNWCFLFDTSYGHAKERTSLKTLFYRNLNLKGKKLTMFKASVTHVTS